jgi:hypothetical protein
MSTATPTTESTTPPRPSVADAPPKLKRFKTAAFGTDDARARAYVLPKGYVRRPLYLDDDEAALIEEIGVCVEYKELSIHSLKQVLKYVMDAPMVPLEPSDERDMHVAQMIATAAQGAADFVKREYEQGKNGKNPSEHFFLC